MKPAAILLAIATLALGAPAFAGGRHDGGGAHGAQPWRVDVRNNWRDGGGRGDGGRPWRQGDGPWRGGGGQGHGGQGGHGHDGGDDGGDGRDRDGNGRGPNSLGAGWRQQQDEARWGVRQGGYRPLREVIPQIQRRTPGRMLDTGLETWGGRPVYRVRWAAANGRRMDFIVDARTGAVLTVEGR